MNKMQNMVNGLTNTQEENSIDEMLDLVDQNDCVVNTMARGEVYQKNLCAQMRSIWLMLKNTQGQLWIPRRSAFVDRLPGYLDGSVSGHVRAGESYQQALLRETQEEIGIDLTGLEYAFVGKLTPHEHKSFCFAEIYEMVVPQAPQNWNRQEIGDWYWLTPQELLQRESDGDKLKDMLPIIMNHFYIK